MEHINVFNILIPEQLNEMFSMDFAYYCSALFIEPIIFPTHGSCLSLASFFSPAFIPSLLENSLKQVIRRATIWGNFLCAGHCNKFTAYIIASILRTQRLRNYDVYFGEAGIQRWTHSLMVIFRKRRVQFDSVRLTLKLMVNASL